LPVLYVQNKGTSAYHDVKNAEASSDTMEPVSTALDDFCARLTEPGVEKRHLYT